MTMMPPHTPPNKNGHQANGNGKRIAKNHRRNSPNFQHNSDKKHKNIKIAEKFLSKFQLTPWKLPNLPPRQIIGILCTVVPIAIAGSLLAQEIKRLTNEQLSQMQLLRTQDLANHFAEFMISRYREAKLISSEPLFTDVQLWQNSNSQQKQAILESFKTNLKVYDQVTFLDLLSRQIWQTETKQRPVIGNYDNSAEKSPQTLITNYLQQELTNRAIKTGRIQIGNFNSNESGQLMWQIVVPIQRQNEVSGLIWLQLSGLELHQFLSRNKQENQEWQLLNSEGKVFAATSQEDLQKSGNNYFSNFKELQSLSQKAITIYSDLEQRKKPELITYTPVSFQGEIPDLNIGAVITAKTEIVLDLGRKIENLMLIVTAIFTILIAIYAANLSNPTTKVSQANPREDEPQVEPTLINTYDYNNLIQQPVLEQQLPQLAQQINIVVKNTEIALQSMLEAIQKQTTKIAIATTGIQKMADSSELILSKTEENRISWQELSKNLNSNNPEFQQNLEREQNLQQLLRTTTTKTKQLALSSQKMLQALNLIANCTDKIDLLALNASLEATHLNNTGNRHNLANVAQQVRSLSQQTTVATQEIQILIAKIQNISQELTTNITTGQEQLTDEVKFIEQIKLNWQTMTAVSNKIQTLVEMMTEFVLQQSQGNKAINQSLTQTTELSMQTEQQIREILNNWKQLNMASKRLQEITSQNQ